MVALPNSTIFKQQIKAVKDMKHAKMEAEGHTAKQTTGSCPAFYFFPCLSTINTLHTFPSACEDRHSPAWFRAAQNQLGELMNSNAAGTVQEECSSPPSALQVALLGGDDTNGSSPPGLTGLANRQRR